jgi:hypothetical protein
MGYGVEVVVRASHTRIVESFRDRFYGFCAPGDAFWAPSPAPFIVVTKGKLRSGNVCERDLVRQNIGRAMAEQHR